MPIAPFQSLTKLCLALLLFTLLTGCGKTILDDSATVSGDSYYTARLNTSSQTKVTLNLTSNTNVDCYLMSDTQYSSFQSLHQRGGFGTFMYAKNLSQERTTNFSASANVPKGTWVIVVMPSRNGAFAEAGSADIKLKLTGNFSATATGGGITGSPTPSPGIATPGINRGRGPNFQNPNNAPAWTPPPPPPLKLTFTNLDEALAILAQGRPPERAAALSYIDTQPVSANLRAPVVTALLPLLQDQAHRSTVRPMIIKWAAKENAPALRTALQTLVADNAFTPNPSVADDALPLAKQLLSFGDDEALPVLVRLMRAPTQREAARAALEARGTPAEKPVLAALADPRDSRDPRARQELVAILGIVGTEESILPLQAAISHTDADLSRTANESLFKLAARLKLKPEQYRFNLFNRYVIDAPVGFTEDTSINQPNTRQWKRTGVGRAITSTYTVQVKRVDKDFRPNWRPGDTVQAGPLTFRRLDTPVAGRSTQTAHIATLDGEYFIEITAIADTADRIAGPNMSAAMTKIRAK